MNITVYLGAHEGNDPSYRKAVEELGAWIAGNGNRLVYGGSDEGLMAVIADAVLSHGGEVTGIDSNGVIISDSASAPVYDLKGVRVSNGSLEGLPKGLYIQGGKKVYVK